MRACMDRLINPVRSFVRTVSEIPVPKFLIRVRQPKSKKQRKRMSATEKLLIFYQLYDMSGESTNAPKSVSNLSRQNSKSNDKTVSITCISS